MATGSERASAVLADARDLASQPLERVLVEAALGMHFSQRQEIDAAMKALDAAVAAAEPLGRAAVLTAETFRASVAVSVHRIADAAERRLEELAATCEGDSPPKRQLLVTLAYARAMSMRGHATDVHALVTRGAGDDGLINQGFVSWSPFFVASTLGLADFLDESGEYGERAAEACAAAGIDVGLVCAVAWGAHLALVRGDLDEVELRVRESLAIAGHERFPFGRPCRVWLLVEPRVARGDLDGALRILEDQGYAGAFPDQDLVIAGMLLRTRAGLHLAQGRRAAAERDVDLMLHWMTCGAASTPCRSRTFLPCSRRSVGSTRPPSSPTAMSSRPERSASPASWVCTCALAAWYGAGRTGSMTCAGRCPR